MVSRVNERNNSNDSPKQLINFDKLVAQKKKQEEETNTLNQINLRIQNEYKYVNIVLYLRKRK